MIASMTYCSAADNDLTGPTDAAAGDTDMGCAVYYEVEYDTSSNAVFYDDYELLLKEWARMDRDELREKGMLASKPWPLPDPPMLRPCRLVNRMMRPNQIGRKTVFTH